jgi:hypothetical protein
MYRWYEGSKIWYAFLSDLSGDADPAEAAGSRHLQVCSGQESQK